ncbi:cilia- and flagella-associated protein 61-like [Colias croceus]|uniref:cilia- and flagella-associated protein 61-like n=1 Tax=Colias crocea TaxID=72248 RepID=UPI001E281846|nr:cilia- and flagella-associated protein 61-like [Colias croceus]
MINDKQEVIGFMSLCDYPDIPAVNPADWETWMRNMYRKFYLSRNTLFIHAMCCTDSIVGYFLEEALISLFNNDVYLQQVILMVPPNCPRECIVKYQTIKKHNYMKNKAKRTDDDDVNYHYFYSALRQDFCPKLRIRRAVEEDNDDVVAILEKSCPKLRELYGDYYISEIIGRHPEMKRKIIVSEGLDGVSGVMCLNSDINYAMLQNTYELDSYHGLQKSTAIERERNKRGNMLLRTFGEPIMLGKWSPFDISPHLEQEQVQDEQSTDNVSLRPRSPSKVNFAHRSSMRYSFDCLYLHSKTSDDYSDKVFITPVQSHTTFVDCLLDEDPFDYEIVNIDHHLLTVPEVLSREFLPANIKHEESRKSSVPDVGNKYKRRTSMRVVRDVNETKNVKFCGEPNAFMIELFGFHKDVDDRHAFDLLEAAFEVMKDYDYCIIRVPCSGKSMPLLQHFAFVPTKNHITCEYALYVAHRCSVLSKLRVRRAEIIDIPQIAQLLYSLDGRETMWSVENTILRRNELEAYVFLSNVSVVGIGILEPPEQIDFIRAKFNIDAHRIHKYHVKDQDYNAGFATLKTVLIYPAFEPHYRFFVRDMMRQSGIHSLIWLTAYRNKWMAHKLNSFASVMIPLLPRMSDLDYAPVPELNKLHKLSNSLMAFSCWFISRKSTSVPKVTVDSRLVIVGASRTAMAFLNTLLFGDTSSYLFFTNVTLISPQGLPYVRNSKTLAEMMLMKYHTSSERYLKSVPYTYYVNTVQSSMVEINKRQKYITLTNGSKYYYDRLFILCGKQYQHPDYLKDVLEQERSVKSGIMEYTPLDVPQSFKEPSADNFTPGNVFIVNNITDANKALNFVRSIVWEETSGKILVYGSSINVYCCIATLLEMKVPPQNIIFIENFPPKDPKASRVSSFCNTYVDKTMQEVLSNLKIKVYRTYYFQSWLLDCKDYVSHVQFMSHYRFVRLECAAFFYYGCKGVNEQLFMAIHKSGMAYDGGIVIDHNFRTNDPNIYAAGPITRYHRRYYAATRRHKYYDAYEIGMKLGAIIRNELDPLFTNESNEPAKEYHMNDRANENKTTCMTESKYEMLCINISLSLFKCSKEEDTEFHSVPDFKMPIVKCCTLPGGLQYLEVRSPGMKVPHHYVQSLDYNGYIIETFKEGYFKIHFNKDLIVDGITCLTPEKYSLENFKRLYGLSSSVLSNVHLRYMTKRLDNLYKFFREPWAHFLYHDQVDELFAIVKELVPLGQAKGETIKDVLKVAVDKLDSTSLTYEVKLELRNSFEKSPHIEAITNYVIQWVSENDVLLPMYLQPSETSAYAHDLEKNPTFRRRRRSVVKMLAAIC